MAFTTKTPLRATTMMKSATAASETKYFSPVSLPLAAVSWMSRGFQLAFASRMATVERASPRQMGARYFCLVRGRGDGVEDRTGQHDGGEKRAGQERAARFFHQQHEFDFAEADAAVLFRKNDAGVALVGELGPKRGVVGGVRFHQAAHFGAGTFAGEEFARAVFQKFLAFAQSELHGVPLLSFWPNSFWAGRERNGR